MGPLQLILLAALCLNACVNGPELHNGKSASHPIVKQSFIRKHFLKRRISYGYGDATFQLELLKYGDINPNPGPDRQISSSSSNTRTGDGNVQRPNSTVQRVNYTPLEILQWRNYSSTLSENIICTVKSLGIQRTNVLRPRKKKTGRGTRGGRGRRINVVILILVVKAVVSASRGQLDNDKMKQIKAGLRSTMLLLPLLGIPWLLTPLVAAFSHVKALEYTFISLNTLQGFFVALFYCFLNSEVRNAIGETIRKARDNHALNNNAPTGSTNDGSSVNPGLRKIRVAPTPGHEGCSTQNEAGTSQSSSNTDE